MRFTIGDDQLTLNLMDASDTFERLEHQAKIVKRYPNVQLLDLVAAWIERQCGGQVSRTVAWAVWWSVHERIEALRQSVIRHADVAAAYHINPFAMTDDQFVGLYANIPRVNAQQILASGKYDRTDYRAVYDLVLLATGSKQKAERAKIDALERYVDAQIRRGNRGHA